MDLKIDDNRPKWAGAIRWVDGMDVRPRGVCIHIANKAGWALEPQPFGEWLLQPVDPSWDQRIEDAVLSGQELRITVWGLPANIVIFAA